MGLITELRPRHGLAELRAAVELRNLAFFVDDDFAAGRSARGFPKGRGQDGGTLDQESALFVRRNGDFRRFLVRGLGIFLLFRGIGGAGTGWIWVTRNTGLAGKRFTLARKLLEYESVTSKASPGQAILTTLSQLDSSG